MLKSQRFISSRYDDPWSNVPKYKIEHMDAKNYQILYLKLIIYDYITCLQCRENTDIFHSPKSFAFLVYVEIRANKHFKILHKVVYKK